MNLMCMIGLHNWYGGCKCTDCGGSRDKMHDWSKDCERCELCGKTRGGGHDWSRNCEECRNCSKTRREAHTWDGCVCSKCGRKRDQGHLWNGCQCQRCKLTRDQDHFWEGCQCAQCKKTRDHDDHSWNGCICTKCGIRRDTEHELIMKQYALAPPCVECARCHRVFKADAALDVLLRDNKRVLLDLVKALGDRRMTYARHKEISNIFYACGDGIAPHLFALLLAPSVLHGDAYGPLLSRIQTFRWQPSTDDDRTIFYLNTGNSKTLVEMGERALSGLHKCLLAGLLTPSGACWQTHVDTLMKAAKDAIVSLRDAAIPDACRLLLHQDPKVRKTGAQILGGVASPACAPPLLAAFTDSDAPVRAMITWALGKIHSADVISALVAGTSDVDPDVRKNSVSAMMRIEDQRCRDAVVTLLDSEKNEAVLEVAIVSVGHFKDARAVPALASLLRAHWDRATNLTVRAAHLLGVIGGTEAVAVLLEAVGLVGQGKTLFDAKTSDPSSEPYCFGPVCEALAMLRCAQAIGPLTRVYTAHPSSSFAECAGKAIWSILAAAIRDVSTPDLESVLETESFKYSSGVVFNSWDDSSFSREYHYDMTEAHLMARSELSRRSSP